MTNDAETMGARAQTHRFVRTGVLLGLVGMLALLVAACQSAPTKSGFLKSYSHLEANPEYKSDLVYIKPGVDMRSYHYLLIDPVQIHLASDSLAAEFGPDVLEKVDRKSVV